MGGGRGHEEGGVGAQIQKIVEEEEGMGAEGGKGGEGGGGEGGYEEDEGSEVSGGVDEGAQGGQGALQGGARSPPSESEIRLRGGCPAEKGLRLRGGMPMYKGQNWTYPMIFYDMITEPPERYERAWGKKMPFKNMFSL